jgi:mannose-6-phosphate isomerase-like protein (cupin superfamily)
MKARQAYERVLAIRREEYAPFENQKHLFLTGDLQQPNSHPFFRDARIECILCFYQPGDNGAFHWHNELTEYETVLEGEIGYFEVATGETNWFREGDFIVIPPGVCVKRVVRERARTLAMKVPSSAERTTCSCCERECAWRISPYRGRS